MKTIKIDTTKTNLTYLTYSTWAEKVGLERNYDPVFAFSHGDWRLTSINIPEDFAIIFKLEFSV